MSHQVLGQILVLLLIIICCSRMFFLKFGKVDSLAVLAPVSVLLSVLLIFAWKINLFSVLIFIISLFNFFINFRAFLRFISGLYVDHYSLKFKISSILTILLAVFELGILILYFPVSIFDKSFTAKQETVRLSGNFRTGFSRAPTFIPTSSQINIFTDSNKSNCVVLFFPDKRADSEQYFPFFKMLSQKGYTVISADLYANDLKWFYSVKDLKFLRRASMIASYLKNPVFFESEREFYLYNSKQECEAVYNFVKNSVPKDSKFYLIGDQMTFYGVEEFYKENKANSKIFGIYNFSEIEEYNSKGFGFIENLNPFLAEYLNFNKKTDYENVKICAEKVDSKIRNSSDKIIFQKEIKKEKDIDDLNKLFTQNQNSIILRNLEKPVKNILCIEEKNSIQEEIKNDAE